MTLPQNTPSTLLTETTTTVINSCVIINIMHSVKCISYYAFSMYRVAQRKGRTPIYGSPSRFEKKTLERVNFDFWGISIDTITLSVIVKSKISVQKINLLQK